ncbi:hypothetical protein CPB85DRAFT_789881 [Mucidula mucida]|nr:hypothetical protein CPB85DRAFT_789881 [Mucidula mucida]
MQNRLDGGMYVWRNTTRARKYALLCGPFPMLESLNLHLTRALHVDSSAEQRSVFSHCPRLTKVVLTGTQLVELPWAQIRELCLEDVRQDWDDAEAAMQFVSLVGRCPNLVVFQARDFEVEEIPPPSTTICPSIRVLDTAIEFVMDCLTLPNLQEVILSKDVHNPHKGALPPFHRLLQRSQCSGNLTSLSIPLYSMYNIAHDLHTILSEMTHLEVLDIQVSGKHSDQDIANLRTRNQIKKVLDALSVASQDIVTFLPCLSSFNLDLNYQFPYCETPGRLVTMLKARWEGDDMRGLAKLKRFQFSLSGLWLYVRWRLCGNADEIGMRRGVLSDEEGRVLHGLAMDGMDVAIKVRSVDATTTVKSKLAQQVPGEPAPQEAEYRELLVSSAMY